MSKLPERKALKEILIDLKSKTLTSEQRYKQLETEIIDLFENCEREVLKLTQKRKDLIGLVSIVESLRLHLRNFVSNSNTTLEDMQLYIKSLERYSTELDKTLTDIIKEAEKLANEQIKQQKELMKRKAPKSYTV